MEGCSQGVVGCKLLLHSDGYRNEVISLSISKKVLILKKNIYHESEKNNNRI